MRQRVNTKCDKSYSNFKKLEPTSQQARRKKKSFYTQLLRIRGNATALSKINLAYFKASKLSTMKMVNWNWFTSNEREALC